MVVTVPDTPRARCPAHGKPVAGSQPSHVAGQHVNCSHPKARASRQAGNRELFAGAALCYVPCSRDIWLSLPAVLSLQWSGCWEWAAAALAVPPTCHGHRSPLQIPL